MQKIKKWESWGAVISIVIGSMFHFIYEWSGGSKFVAIFGAVNESSWEHLKIAFWPTFIFAVIEFFVYGKTAKNFFAANFIKLITIPIVILALFYGWLAVFPDSLIWDILIFALAIITAYYLSYKTLQTKKSVGTKAIWVTLILLWLAANSLFTFFPPQNFLFQDPVKGGYGIEK